MPTFRVTDPQTGQTLRLTGDSPPTEQELEQIFSANRPVDGGTGVGDVVKGAGQLAATAVSQLGEQAVEGIAEIGGLIRGKGLDRSIAEAQQLTEQIPDIELGDEGQALVQSISEKFNASPALVQTIARSFLEMGPVLGKETFERTGSPLLAAAVETIPSALEAATSVKGIKSLSTAGKKAIPDVLPSAETAKEVATGVFKRQSPTKQRIARLLDEGSTDVETARFKLDKPRGDAPDVPLLEPPRTRLQKALNIGGPRVKKDRVAVNAINQGFDEGVIAAVKGASVADKIKMRRMSSIMERGKKNAKFAATNRPSDVVGDSLLERLKSVQSANRAAGKRLEAVSKSLKGKRVDFGQSVDGFIDDLGDMGIQVSDDLTLNFKGSDIEGLAGPEAAINRIFKRMRNTRTPDAFDVHRMKKFIDEQVTFGKNAEGLAGKSERILKKLRANLDNTLDSNFPEYDKVNSVYSETIGAIDEFQKVSGNRMNLTGKNADKAVGTLLRRLMSNAQSRVNLLDSVNQIESLAKKHGGKFKDDLITQVLFVDELDRQFGPVARTSLQGQVKQAVEGATKATRGPVEFGVDVAAAGLEKARGINQENAFKAINQLLGEQ